jgi:chorismate-pyruvate lyase
MLKEITPTESVIANQVAARLVSEILNTAKRVVAIRAEGIPAIAAVPATPEQTLPDGRKIPARPARSAVPAISAEAINAALGTDNCALLDSIKTSLF